MGSGAGKAGARNLEESSAMNAPILAYCDKQRRLIQWQGEPIGTWRVVSSWPTPAHQQWISLRRYAIEATVNGVRYHGRTYGQGMAVMLYPYKHQ